MDEMERDDPAARSDPFGSWLLGTMLGVGGAVIVCATLWSSGALVVLIAVLAWAAIFSWRQARRARLARRIEELAPEPPKLASVEREVRDLREYAPRCPRSVERPFLS